jgi:phage replication O-like protein O
MKFEVNSFQVPNALVDELLTVLSGNDLKVYLFIVRKTKGWQKNSDYISLSQFVEALNLKKDTVLKSINTLINLGLIVKNTDKRTTKYTLKTCQNHNKNSPKNRQIKDNQTVQKIDLISPKNGHFTSPKNGHTKDTIKDTIKKDSNKTLVSFFKPPKIDEINDYIKEKKLNVNSETFFYYYESIGWKVGNKPMKDWRASLRYWNYTNRKTNKADEVNERWFI